jgi:hypothetical protein
MIVVGWISGYTDSLHEPLISNTMFDVLDMSLYELPYQELSRPDRSIPYLLSSHVGPVLVLTHACYHTPLASLFILSGIETQLYKSNAL